MLYLNTLVLISAPLEPHHTTGHTESIYSEQMARNAGWLFQYGGYSFRGYDLPHFTFGKFVFLRGREAEFPIPMVVHSAKTCERQGRTYQIVGKS
jgi:hypothetical protein